MTTRFASIISAGLLLIFVSSGSAAAADENAQPREKAILDEHRFGASPVDLAFSPDSKLLAVADLGDKSVSVWNVAAGKVAMVLPHRSPRHVLFSPDGKIVATASHHLKLWEAATGKELATFKSVPARWMLFSADSKKLAAICKDEITIVSVEKNKALRTYDIPLTRREVFGYPSLKQPVYAVLRGGREPIALVDPFTEKEETACTLNMTPAAFALDQEEKILYALGWENHLRKLTQWKMYLWDRGKRKGIADFILAAGCRKSLALSLDGKSH